MRCPHCVGEIQDGSVFCGICGKPTAADGRSAGASSSAARTGERSGATRQPDATSPSLFELPVSPGARAVRIAVVLVLDALLLIAGIAMIVSYLNDRDHARTRPRESGGAHTHKSDAASVVFAEPVPVKTGSTTPTLTSERPTGPRVTRSGKRRKRVRRRVKHQRRDAAKHGRRPVDAAVPGPADAGVSHKSAALDAGGAVASAADAGPGGDPYAPSDAEVAILARQIRLVVNRERRLLSRCYHRAAKMTTVEKAPRGRVEIRFEVLPDGKTINVSPHGNTTGSNLLASCVANLIRNWKFPSHSGKRGIPFVWPFDFRGS